jgi:hypothetical protein
MKACLLVIILLIGIISSKDRVVQTTLQSSWPFYPLHTEVRFVNFDDVFLIDV